MSKVDTIAELLLVSQFQGGTESALARFTSQPGGNGKRRYLGFIYAYV